MFKCLYKLLCCKISCELRNFFFFLFPFLIFIFFLSLYLNNCEICFGCLFYALSVNCSLLILKILEMRSRTLTCEIYPVIRFNHSWKHDRKNHKIKGIKKKKSFGNRENWKNWFWPIRTILCVSGGEAYCNNTL